MPGIVEKVLRRGRYDFGDIAAPADLPYSRPANVKGHSLYDISSLKPCRRLTALETCQEINGKVLVTGASGFVASHCIKQLQELGYPVRGTVRSLNDAKKVAPLYQLCPDAAHKLELVEADLVEPTRWVEAVSGCTYVLHVASPFTMEIPADEQVFIRPAVEGTLNVLRACVEAGSVKRVILTSSIAAISGEASVDPSRNYTEENWTNLDVHVPPYQKSKTLAEKAAWDFVKSNKGLELAVINPSYVLGPVYHGATGASQEVVGRMLKRELPALPHVTLQICDVRDVAAAHIKAMTLPEAAGNRFIVNSGGLWFKDIARILDQEFRPQGYKLTSLMAPKFLISLASWFDKSLTHVLLRWGHEYNYDNTKMRKVLRIEPRPLERTLIDMAYSMIENGLIPKTPEYHGQTYAEGTVPTSQAN